ncbi:hypothetical protein [Methylorubrum aminovorans]|uniref:hypothetical protein n=1 Tax=Methylorubrum aminovorans TaxID=269069 RepID=UPI0024E0D280|nr:hypothetical protein [Methylorubrum aminovorans]
MLAGGTTDVSDIIAHFIGHLRLTDGAPRVRDGYEDPAQPAKLHPWLPRPPVDPDPDRPLDEFPSRPFRVDLSPGPEVFPRLPGLPGHRPLRRARTTRSRPDRFRADACCRPAAAVAAAAAGRTGKPASTSTPTSSSCRSARSTAWWTTTSC